MHGGSEDMRLLIKQHDNMYYCQGKAAFLEEQENDIVGWPFSCYHLEWMPHLLVL